MTCQVMGFTCLPSSVAYRCVSCCVLDRERLPVVPYPDQTSTENLGGSSTPARPSNFCHRRFLTNQPAAASTSAAATSAKGQGDQQDRQYRSRRLPRVHGQQPLCPIECAAGHKWTGALSSLRDRAFFQARPHLHSCKLGAEF